MLILEGQVLNVLKRPERTGKDGTKYGGDCQVQLTGEEVLENGETRFVLHDLLGMDYDSFMEKDGEQFDGVVQVPVRAYVTGNRVGFQPLSDKPLKRVPVKELASVKAAKPGPIS